MPGPPQRGLVPPSHVDYGEVPVQAQDKEKVCQYRVEWAWISEFRDYQPHADDQKLDGNAYNPKLSGPDTTKANCLGTQLDNYNNDRPVSTC